ncbi:MAG: glycosyltransferase [Gemmatimonadota bacterium]|nr:glycosyltransferase [Gemmatimonadota bacterium]
MEGSASIPFFSVVVPVRDGGRAFARCLEALADSRFHEYELVVVDDGSTDDSRGRAERAGARVFETGGGLGPAAARNLGASEARGRWLLFLDADCAVHADTLARAAAILRSEPRLVALFGSYDADPADPGLVSRYRNLLHHHVHQRGRTEASTFWAGFGAVRRKVFETVGGFDAERYRRPSVEDIDLGVRLRARGHEIRLAPDVQVTHLKSWSLAEMVRTDALRRAAPWTELALRAGGFPRDLNASLRGRAGVAATGGAVACLAASPWAAWLLPVGAGLAAVTVALDIDLFRLLRERGGFRLVAAAVPLHALHHLSAAFGFLLGLARHVRGSRRNRRTTGTGTRRDVRRYDSSDSSDPVARIADRPQSRPDTGGS